MSDYTDMLAEVKAQIREKSNTLVDDTDVLRELNYGGEDFADRTQCIRDLILVPIAAGGAMTNQHIVDTSNTFDRITVDAGLDLYRYNISKCLFMNTVTLVGAESRSDDNILEAVSTREIRTKQFLDPNQTEDYPHLIRFFANNEFDLWPRWTKTGFSLQLEYRRDWFPLVESTQEVNYLPRRFQRAPIAFAIWKCGLQSEKWEIAEHGKEEYTWLLMEALDEIDKRDSIAHRDRRIVQSRGGGYRDGFQR